MSRRNRSGPVISLFAFQDIITSVSGIIIVMVLLLSLELVDRPDAKSEQVTSAVAVDLRAALAEAEAELSSLQSSVRDLNELLEEVAETSPAELESEIDLLSHNIEDKRYRIRRLQNQFEELKKEEKEVLVEQFDLEDERRQLAEVREEIDQLDTQREQEQEEDRLVFSLPKGFKKSGWIAVVESNKIETAILGQESRPIQFMARRSGLLGKDSAADQFFEWASDKEASSRYFMLLIRPSGVAEFHDLESRLSLRGISFGFDLIGEEQVVLDPERGAAP